MLTRLVPNIFYARMDDALDLFVTCLGFGMLHREGALAVVARDGVKVCLVEDPLFAAKDRPEITLETDDIEAAYAEVASNCPHCLHPNGNTVTQKPWGSLEFAVRDKTDVCVIFRQW